MPRRRPSPDSPAIRASDGTVVLSYGELESSVRTLVARLRRLGVSQNDTIAIVSDNRVELAVAFLAVVSAGAVAAMVDPSLTVPEIASTLAALNAMATIVPDRSLGELLAMFPEEIPGSV